MEFSVREWTIIVGVLLIVAVFLDGYRRVRNERSNRLRVSLSKQVFAQAAPAPVESDATNPELPNGGARVIGKRREDLRLQQSLNVRQPVPVLIEPVAVAPLPESPAASIPENEPAIVAVESALAQPEADARVGRIAERAAEIEEELEPLTEEQLDAFAAEPFCGEASSGFAAREEVEEELTHEGAFEERAGDDDSYNEHADNYNEHAVDEEHEQPVDVLNLFGRNDKLFGRSDKAEAKTPLKPLRKFFNRKDSIVVAESEPEAVEPQEVLVVNVLSKDGGFKGPDLLQLLLACDLRFGKKSIFHRYEKAGAKGAIQFSVANLVEPGTFDLDAIDEFTTPGVSFFLSLPGPDKPLVAFNYMIETAQVLVRHLHAELRDDAHSVMTAQTIEHCRQRIRDFERKQLTLQL